MAHEDEYARWQTLPAMFFELAGRHAERPLFWHKVEGAWTPYSWREVAEQVDRLARALRARGVGPGDRVLLVSENRPEWGIAHMAVMATRAITVPAYVTNTVDDHRHIVTDSGATAAIVSTEHLAERLLPALDGGAVSALISIEPLRSAPPAGVSLDGWDDALAAGAAQPDDLAATLSAAERSEPACIIYTSGTGGAPKGVVLSHGAVLCNCFGAHQLLKPDFGLIDEVFLSFLPLSHSYEHTAGLMFPISIGAQIYYAESLERLVGNIDEVRPTMMTAVPRLYETMYHRITHGVSRQGALRRKLFEAALELGKQRYRSVNGLDPIRGALDAVLERLVRNKVRARFGGRLKGMVSGGAPLNQEIGLFFTALGIPILQGYGQTEAAPVVSCNPLSRPKLHTVGPPLADGEVRIAEDGEILVRGELVMNGYWGLEELTRSTVIDGWLYTGDIGLIDEDGYIQITDRKKDVIVNSGGDNISPAHVEGMLTLEPEIAQAMVHGDRRPHLVALLVPGEEFLRTYAQSAGKPPDLAALRDDAGLHDALMAAVDRVNKRLSTIEKVRRFSVASEPWTIENGVLTPSMKVKRHVLRDQYQEQLEALY